LYKERGGTTRYIRGFDVLEINPTFTVGKTKIVLDTKGQMILGHMPDRALVMDMQMSLAAFNIVKRELPLSDSDTVFRGITDGSVDPRELLKAGGKNENLLSFTNLQKEINESSPVKEYAILKKFELDYQDAQLKDASLTFDDLVAFARRNITINQGYESMMKFNWKVDLLKKIDFSNADKLDIRTLSKEQRTELRTPDRSTISDAKGFASLVKNYANALEGNAITFVHCKSGQGRSATVAAAVYIERVMRQIGKEDLKNVSRKDLDKLIDDAISFVENPITGRIQAKISAQQRPVLEQFLAKRVLEINS
jgi:hypothetical protein